MVPSVLEHAYVAITAHVTKRTATVLVTWLGGRD